MVKTAKRSLLAASLGAALGLATFGASSAHADPGGEPLTIHCDTLGSIDVIVVGKAALAPGLVVGGNQVAIPYRITITGTFTPTDGDPAPFADEFERPAPSNGRLDHCTFHQEGALEDGTFVLDGDIWITYTP